MLPNLMGQKYTYSNFNEFIVMADTFLHILDSATDTTMDKS